MQVFTDEDGNLRFIDDEGNSGLLRNAEGEPYYGNIQAAVAENPSLASQPAIQTATYQAPAYNTYQEAVSNYSSKKVPWNYTALRGETGYGTAESQGGLSTREAFNLNALWGATQYAQGRVTDFSHIDPTQLQANQVAGTTRDQLWDTYNQLVAQGNAPAKNPDQVALDFYVQTVGPQGNQYGYGPGANTILVTEAIKNKFLNQPEVVRATGQQYATPEAQLAAAREFGAAHEAGVPVWQVFEQQGYSRDLLGSLMPMILGAMIFPGLGTALTSALGGGVAGQIAAASIIGGVNAELQGGNFLDGAIKAALTAGTGAAIANVGIAAEVSSALKSLDFAPDVADLVAKTAERAVTSAVVAEATGGNAADAIANVLLSAGVSVARSELGDIVSNVTAGETAADIEDADLGAAMTAAQEPAAPQEISIVAPQQPEVTAPIAEIPEVYEVAPTPEAVAPQDILSEISQEAQPVTTPEAQQVEPIQEAAPTTQEIVSTTPEDLAPEQPAEEAPVTQEEIVAEITPPAPAPAPVAPMTQQDMANLVLKMATGVVPPDMSYDIDGDGKITARDARAIMRGAQPAVAQPAPEVIQQPTPVPVGPVTPAEIISEIQPEVVTPTPVEEAVVPRETVVTTPEVVAETPSEAVVATPEPVVETAPVETGPVTPEEILQEIAPDVVAEVSPEAAPPSGVRGEVVGGGLVTGEGLDAAREELAAQGFDESMVPEGYRIGTAAEYEALPADQTPFGIELPNNFVFLVPDTAAAPSEPVAIGPEPEAVTPADVSAVTIPAAPPEVAATETVTPDEILASITSPTTAPEQAIEATSPVTAEQEVVTPEQAAETAPVTQEPVVTIPPEAPTGEVTPEEIFAEITPEAPVTPSVEEIAPEIVPEQPPLVEAAPEVVPVEEAPVSDQDLLQALVDEGLLPAEAVTPETVAPEVAPQAPAEELPPEEIVVEPAPVEEAPALVEEPLSEEQPIPEALPDVEPEPVLPEPGPEEPVAPVEPGTPEEQGPIGDEDIMQAIADEAQTPTEEVPPEEEPTFTEPEPDVTPAEELPPEEPAAETPAETPATTAGPSEIDRLIAQLLLGDRGGAAAPQRRSTTQESVSPREISGSVTGIIGKKQPMFGGDEDAQTAEWNRRSLRLRKILGL